MSQHRCAYAWMLSQTLSRRSAERPRSFMMTRIRCKYCRKCLGIHASQDEIIRGRKSANGPGCTWKVGPQLVRWYLYNLSASQNVISSRAHRVLVCVCMSVYMCVHMYVHCMCIGVCIGIVTGFCIYGYMCAYRYMLMCMCLCMSKQLYAYMFMFLYICLCVCVCVWCMYVYM